MFRGIWVNRQGAYLVTPRTDCARRERRWARRDRMSPKLKECASAHLFEELRANISMKDTAAARGVLQNDAPNELENYGRPPTAMLVARREREKGSKMGPGEVGSQIARGNLERIAPGAVKKAVIGAASGGRLGAEIETETDVHREVGGI